MIKPRWLLAGVALLGSAGLAGAIVVASPGGQEEIVQVETASPTASAIPKLSATPSAQPSATPAPDAIPTPAPVAAPDCSRSSTAADGTTLWRWENVTILVSDAEDMSVGRLVAGPQVFPPDGGPVFELRRGDSFASVDAETGKVFVEQIGEADRSAFNQVLATIQVGCPRPTNASPWPYGTAEPVQGKPRRGNVLYWEPAPDSGLVLQRVVRDFSYGGDEVLMLLNAGSRRVIDIDTGKVSANNDRIAPEDAEAFERWTQAVEVVAP